MIDDRICRGFKTPCEPLEDKTQLLITELLPECRKELVEKFGTLEHYLFLYAGSNFKNDELVMARIASNWEALTKKYIDVKARIKDALIDCMASDYYYTYEKDWGYDEEDL